MNALERITLAAYSAHTRECAAPVRCRLAGPSRECLDGVTLRIAYVQASENG